MRMTLLMTIAMMMRAIVFSKVLVTTITMAATAVCVVANALRCPESFEDSGTSQYPGTTQKACIKPLSAPLASLRRPSGPQRQAELGPNRRSEAGRSKVPAVSPEM